MSGLGDLFKGLGSGGSTSSTSSGGGFDYNAAISAGANILDTAVVNIFGTSAQKKIAGINAGAQTDIAKIQAGAQENVAKFQLGLAAQKSQDQSKIIKIAVIGTLGIGALFTIAYLVHK